MAPSGMFSYLRPHHKRSSSGSKPVSTLNPSPLYSTDSVVSSPEFQANSQVRLTRSNSPHSSVSPVSPLPPILPQIPRVASTIDHQRDSSLLDPQNAWGSQCGSTEGTRRASDALRPSSRGETSTGSSLNTHLTVDSKANVNRPQSARSAGPKEFPVGGLFTRSAAPPPLTQSPVPYPATTPASTYYSSSTGNLSTVSTYPNTASGSRSISLNSISSLNPPPRSGKTKLNLLNPMSLLMRRRANQQMARLEDPPQDDYDPRIRGKGVHDFNAPPRLRIISEQGNLSPSQSVGRNLGFPQTDEAGRKLSAGQDYRLLGVDVSSGGDRESPIGPRSGEHTPIFKEHFGDIIPDDGNVDAPWKRQGDQSVGGYLAGSLQQNTTAPVSQTALPPQPPDRSPPPPPPPPEVRDMPPSESPPMRPEVGGPPVDGIEPARYAKPWESLGDDRLAEGLDRLDSGPMGISLAESPAYGSGLPKHFKSNASRFSFEVSGIGSSSQEKLLEEAHRKTMAKRRSELPKQVSNNFVDEFDERFNDEEMGDFDYCEDDGIFEEPIPGVNSDAVEDDGFLEEPIPGVNSDAVEDGGFFEEMVPGVNSDAPEDDGDFEEIIPGVNGDAVEGDDNMKGGIIGFDFGSHILSAVSSPATPYGVNGAGAMGTPRDTEGRVIGYAVSKESPLLIRNFPTDTPESPTQGQEPGRHDSGDGLGLAGVDISRMSDDDELYFNDGIIEPPLEDEGEHAFDESVFDNEDNGIFGLPLRDIKPPMVPAPLRFSVTSTSSPAKYASEDDEDDSIDPQDSQATDTAFPPMMNPSGNGLAYRALLSQQLSLPITENPPPPSVKQNTSMGLTQDNLNAYHNALVAAANAAATNGKLSRRDTTSSSDLEDYRGGNPEPNGSSHPGLAPDSGRASEEVEAGYGGFPSNGFYDTDGFDYDDCLEDDPIIAEANAEALASDDEGFYGSEFGFYAHAAASGQAEYVAGGYFGPRREITRTMSGRMREPNLTPITERSECSNRTSFALSLHGPQGQPGVASPGLAQLVGMMGGGVEDDDMNFKALLKLRRGAFGGSNGSLRSAGSAASQPGGSPLGFLPPLGSTGNGFQPGPGLSAGAGSGYANSPRFPSPNGYASDLDSAPASPTITLGNHPLSRWGGPGQRISSHSEGSSGPASPLAAVFAADAPTKKPKHRREGSGGDSIAYLREEGEDGERWVLERRRTDEFGEVEIVGREIVEGGRI
ncbi:hypothetical protein FGG08_001298 [Glutinoglossum americanum]|uniref:AGC-kinase C-terminal domain-containing protein n=1 Tax=Glutinoglossum americanum TaxID=1670608 RepID=A0A9P8L2V4_9PEZI|nr:hypothetical protein FGG08_001298 [Glutinoglossum americanum]